MKYAYTIVGFALASSSFADECVRKCNEAHNACLGKPNAHRPTCASDYAACLGYNPYTQGDYSTPTACSKAAQPTDSPSPEACDCAKNCNYEYNACRGKPDANRSTCAASYSTCLGYSPFGPDGSLIPPTACAPGAARAGAPGGGAPSGVAPGIGAPATDSPTIETPPGEDTGSSVVPGQGDYPGTIPGGVPSGVGPVTGYPPSESTPSAAVPVGNGPSGSTPASKPPTSGADSPEACAQACYTAYNVCRGKPDANRSTCASEYAGCLGYNPFGSDGSLVTPTACSTAGGSPTAGSSPSGGSSPGASGVPGEYPSGDAHPSGNGASGAGYLEACAEACKNAHNACRTRANANLSTCGSEYASCLGYGNSGSSGSLLGLTACSQSLTPTTTPDTSGGSPNPSSAGNKVPIQGSSEATGGGDASATGGAGPSGGAAPVVTAGGHGVRPTAMAMMVAVGLACL